MEVTGTVIKVGNTYEVGQKNYAKRDLVIETKEKYPQKILIEFGGKNVDALNTVKENQNVEVSINLRGREYNGKFYTSIEGWRVNVLENNVAASEPALVPESNEDELPF